jgi:hypothetical protein
VNYVSSGGIEQGDRRIRPVPHKFSPDELSAEDVALLYGARWSIELVFTELKRVYMRIPVKSAICSRVSGRVKRCTRKTMPERHGVPFLIAAEGSDLTHC